MADRYDLERLEVPIPQGLADELMRLWEGAFGGDFSRLAPILQGSEAAANADTLYLAMRDGRVVSTCRLTVSRRDPRLASLGEVATSPDDRGKGLAGRLCRWSAEDFDARDGRALFLGTVNPIAASVYGRLGWRYLAGSKVMLRTSRRTTPEEFLVDYFRDGTRLPVLVRKGEPGDRVPIIPLILTPGDWTVLDANAGIGSTRWFCQQSCEGLYPRYEALEGRGEWFVAGRSDGAVLGMGSVVPRDGGGWWVEAFAHPRYKRRLASLYTAGTALGVSTKPGPVLTTCAVTDVFKASILPELEFRPTGETLTLDVSGNAVPATVWRWLD